MLQGTKKEIKSTKEINTNRENHQDTIQQTMNQQETTHQSTNHNNK